MLSRKFILQSIHLLLFNVFLSAECCAQNADSILVSDLRKVGVSFTHDNSVSLLTSGEKKFEDMFEAVRQARRSVHLEYFNFRNDSIANALFDLLAEKVAEGVEVRALYDDFGNLSNNQPITTKQLEEQRSRGIQLYVFDPIRFPWVNHIANRDHRKIVVIDGVLAYTGGMNVADYYIHGTEQLGSWRDMHCRIEGSEVETLQRIFLKAWKKVTGESINPEFCKVNSNHFSGLKLDKSTTAGKKMVGIVNREPHTTNKIMRQFYVSAINSAKDSIKLVNPYFTLLGCIRKALNNALARGVKVEIMISEKSDIPLTPDCAFYNLHKLMKRGADVWIYRPGFHHTKVIMVDGRFCTVGSTNLDARSLRWDYEENAVIVDPNTTDELCRIFDADKKDSFKLTEEVWKKWRSRGQRFAGWFGHLIAFWL